MKPITLKNRSIKALRYQKESENSETENQIYNKYGVTEKKKADIDALTNEVLDNQGQVKQQQAIVTSLTEKSNKLQAQLSDAQNNKSVALTNNDLGEEVLNNARDLMVSSEKTYIQILNTEGQINNLSKNINDVINKLIYSVEVINKLAALITKKKASNPLISDELVSTIATAGTDANNAISLTMVALKSVFASQATISEGESSLALEYLQSVRLIEFILAEEVDTFESDDLPKKGIKELLQESYNTAEFVYDRSLDAYQDTQNQLESAKDDLSQSQIRLTSSQAGLAAANAAALAS
jgi:hypothetical protein